MINKSLCFVACLRGEINCAGKMVILARHWAGVCQVAYLIIPVPHSTKTVLFLIMFLSVSYLF